MSQATDFRDVLIANTPSPSTVLQYLAERGARRDGDHINFPDGSGGWLVGEHSGTPRLIITRGAAATPPDGE